MYYFKQVKRIKIESNYLLLQRSHILVESDNWILQKAPWG